MIHTAKPGKMNRIAAVLLAGSLLAAAVSGPIISYASSTDAGSSTITVEVPSTHTMNVSAAEGVTVSYGGVTITGQDSSTESDTEETATSLDVPRLDEFTITVTVESGYAVTGVYLDGEDVTAQLAGDTLTLSGIHADSELVIETAVVSSEINGVLYDLPEQEFPDDSLLYKVAVEVGGLAEVPTALQGIEELDTIEEITTVLSDILISACSYPAQNMAVYEVTLVVSDDNGKTWEKADEDHFPEVGLEVILPYPDGTAMDTHDFVAAHMFTSTAFGKTPGEVEIPDVTKVSSGIQMTLTGLSPVAIMWNSISTVSTETESTETETESTETESTETETETEPVETESTETETESTEAESTETETESTETENTGTASSGDSGGISSVISAVTGAVTGDTPILPFAAVMIAACVAIMLAMKRKNMGK